MMPKKKLLLFSAIFPAVLLYYQQEAAYTVEAGATIRKISVSIENPFGSFSLRPTENPALLKIYGKFAEGISQKMEQAANAGGTVSAKLKVKAKENNAATPAKNQWEAYLSKEIPAEVHLNLGTGEANVDLSDLKIEKLKVCSAGANVWVSFMSGHANMLEMDTFSVQTEVGTITVDRPNLARAKNMIANVAFGTLSLNFSEESLYGTKVKAKVGAGKFLVRLPKSYYPIIIRLKSGLAKTNVPEGFEKNAQGAYINEAYINAQKTGVQKKVLEFDLEISMGTATFSY